MLFRSVDLGEGDRDDEDENDDNEDNEDLGSTQERMGAMTTPIQTAYFRMCG